MSETKTDSLPAAAAGPQPCEDSWSKHLREQKQEAVTAAVLLCPEGFHANRLNPEAGNPREVAFLEQWREEHEHSDLLPQLVCLEPDNRPGSVGMYGFPPMRQARELTEHERRVVSTVIQWLGSNIGMSFIEASLHRFGMRIERSSLTPAAGNKSEVADGVTSRGPE